MTEQLPRHDQAMREADGSEPHDMRAPARLFVLQAAEVVEIPCESAAQAMQVAMGVIHRAEGVPDRIELADGSEIGTVAIRQEYERTLALGGFDPR
jgi:hypothetical protein